MKPKISYSLNSEFVAALATAFPVMSLVENYKKATEEQKTSEIRSADQALDVFGSAGKSLAEMICRLESQFRDRNAEIIYEIAEKTGHQFPSIQQRLIEIAYLSLMADNKSKFKEISFKKIEYEITSCILHRDVSHALGSTLADTLPCRHFCLELLKGICGHTGMADVVIVSMSGQHSEKSGCVFSAELTLVEQIRLMAK